MIRLGSDRTYRYQGRNRYRQTFPARFLIPLQERCPELKTVWGSDCVDGVRAVKNEEEIKIMRQASVINDMVMERAAATLKKA